MRGRRQWIALAAVLLVAADAFGDHHQADECAPEPVGAIGQDADGVALHIGNQQLAALHVLAHQCGGAPLVDHQGRQLHERGRVGGVRFADAHDVVLTGSPPPTAAAPRHRHRWE